MTFLFSMYPILMHIQPTLTLMYLISNPNPLPLSQRAQSGNTMTHKLKLMAHIDLGGLKKTLQEALSGQEEDQDDEQRNSDLQGIVTGAGDVGTIQSRIQASNASRGIRRGSLQAQLAVNQSVVADVSEYLLSKDDEENEMLGLETYAEDAMEEEREELESLQFSLEGHLEKKSPTSKLWQGRFFKILTRTEMDPDTDEKVGDMLEYGDCT